MDVDAAASVAGRLFGRASTLLLVTFILSFVLRNWLFLLTSAFVRCGSGIEKERVILYNVFHLYYFYEIFF